MGILDLYKNCTLCPRDCGIDRFTGKGRCGEGTELRLAFAGLHSGEEPPLSGFNGSGTIFISGCNMGCPLCQNWQISGGSPPGGAVTLGRAVSTEEFASICCALQDKGAENVNIVTGSHAVPAIVRGLSAAQTAGLRIPVLWNSSGYDGIESLELLHEHVALWLPDLKTLDNDLAERFFNAADYPQAATRAILWMTHNNLHNVIVRHLILPGHLESTRAVLHWFADNIAGSARLSLMSQYTQIGNDNDMYPGPRRFLSMREYETVLEWLTEFGIEEGFCQDLVTGNDWLPDFTRPNPFSSALSVPVWHYAR
ncbi:MAG: radical SAM protein [Treponema sp.]|nr:radical SAM protein [Treponema sp.]